MKDVGAEPDKRIVFGETSAPAKETVSPVKDMNNVKDAPDAWTQAQQQKLESALKEFPTSMEPQERWMKIAGRVEGKTKKQCVDRFKEIRNAMINKPKN